MIEVDLKLILPQNDSLMLGRSCLSIYPTESSNESPDTLFCSKATFFVLKRDVEEKKLQLRTGRKLLCSKKSFLFLS